MTPALEQLAELVRQVEAKSRARKIEQETRHAAEQFRAAEQRARQASDRWRAGRAASARTLEQANADEQLLKELVRKLAVYRASLAAEANPEELISASQVEIDRTRREAKREIEEACRELEEARRVLRAAVDHFRTLRKELDRLEPESAAQYAPEDRLLWDAEGHFPGGQLQLLAHEVEAGFHAFGSLSKTEQYARLKVWIGRFRWHQANQEREGDASEDQLALAAQIFRQLKYLSRHYEPGYIEAFRQDFSTDWTAYVAEAQEQFVMAIEALRKAREGDPRGPREPVARRTGLESALDRRNGTAAPADDTLHAH